MKAFNIILWVNYLFYFFCRIDKWGTDKIYGLFFNQEDKKFCDNVGLGSISWASRCIDGLFFILLLGVSILSENIKNLIFEHTIISISILAVIPFVFNHLFIHDKDRYKFFFKDFKEYTDDKRQSLDLICILFIISTFLILVVGIQIQIGFN